MTKTVSWRSAFLINVPVAALILVATPFVVPASSSPSGSSWTCLARRGERKHEQ